MSVQLCVVSMVHGLLANHAHQSDTLLIDSSCRHINSYIQECMCVVVCEYVSECVCVCVCERQ